MPPALLATPSLAGTGIKFEKRLSRLCLIKRNTPVSQNISTHSLTLVKKKQKLPLSPRPPNLLARERSSIRFYEFQAGKRVQSTAIGSDSLFMRK